MMARFPIRDAKRHGKRQTGFGCRPMTCFLKNLHMPAIRTTTLLAILVGGSVVSGQPSASAQEPGLFERIFGNSDRLASPAAPTNSDVEERAERPAGAQNRVAQSGDANMRIDRLE